MPPSSQTRATTPRTPSPTDSAIASSAPKGCAETAGLKAPAAVARPDAVSLEGVELASSSVSRESCAGFLFSCGLTTRQRTVWPSE
eukprot:280292-Pleurochrysis_carterae.AAC.4